MLTYNMCETFVLAIYKFPESITIMKQEALITLDGSPEKCNVMCHANHTFNLTYLVCGQVI